MACPRCSVATPSDAEFCPQCGVKLLAGCWHCGTGNTLASRFCKRCGQSLDVTSPREPRDVLSLTGHVTPHASERLLLSPAATRGERKLVSVLFADVKASLELLSRQDPEDARALLDEILRRMISAVHRHGGTVNQVLGDGVMALFGAPIAEEDHATCACHAGLDIVDSVQSLAADVRARKHIGLHCRVGIHSGEVIVRSIASDFHMDYTAVGLTTHLAARMEQLAEPDSVYVTEDTWHMAQPFVSGTALGPLAVRGLDRSVRSFHLHPTSVRDDSSRARAVHTGPFVGRRSELTFLTEALERSLADDPRVVGIAAHAGVGKSRLCLEFADICRRRGVAVFHAQAYAHSRATPLKPVLDFLRTFFRLTPTDAGQAVKERIEAWITAIDPALAGDAVPLAEFLDVEMSRSSRTDDPTARLEHVLESVRRMVRLGTRREFTLFVIEDLHWMDASSEAFIECLVDAVRGSRAMLILNFRLPYSAPWMQRSYYHQIPLSDLAAPEAQELVDLLLGPHASVREVATRILLRAGGNPFFVRELVRSLVDGGHLRGSRGALVASSDVGEVELPPSVHGVLAARMDRLADTEKETLQTAAVIGQEFELDVLRRIAPVGGPLLDGALARLARAEFIAQSRLGADGTYAFAHPLVQEVAYHSLLTDHRRRLHASIAQALTDVHPTRLDELSALIAFHREGAGEPIAAATACVQAAMWVGRKSPAEALVLWRKARALAQSTPDDPSAAVLRMLACGQLVNLGWRQGMSAEEASRYFEEARAVAVATHDLRSHALVLSAYGRILAARGSADDYVTQVRAASRLAGEADDASLRVVLSAILAHALRMAGRLTDALAAADLAISHLAEINTADEHMLGFSIHSWVLGLRAQTLLYLGELKEASSTLDKMLARTEDDPDPTLRLFPRLVAVELAALTLDADSAQVHASRARELAHQSGAAYSGVYALAAQGIADNLAARWSAASTVLRSALEMARRTHTAMELESRVLAELARAHVGEGRLVEARESARQAIENAARQGLRVTECQAQLVLADACLQPAGPPDAAAAAAAIDRADMLVRETGARILMPPLYRVRARLVRLSGEASRAEAYEAEARRALDAFGISDDATRR